MCKVQKANKIQGPLPKGSRVLIRLTLEESMYPMENCESLSKTRIGLAQLPVRLEVASGRYAGYYWYERITAPKEYQTIPLDRGLLETCRVGASILRAILESSHGIKPYAKDKEADDIRNFKSWDVFDGLIFPAKLDIDTKPVSKRNGSVVWKNTLKYILPVTDRDYETIMAGGEYISKGAISCDSETR